MRTVGNGQRLQHSQSVDGICSQICHPCAYLQGSDELLVCVIILGCIGFCFLTRYGHPWGVVCVVVVGYSACAADSQLKCRNLRLVRFLDTAVYLFIDIHSYSAVLCHHPSNILSTVHRCITAVALDTEFVLICTPTIC